MELVQGSDVDLRRPRVFRTSLKQEVWNDLKELQGEGWFENEHEAKCLDEWLFSEFDFEAKYHLGKANVDVVPWSRKKE
ncbi:hypothetical protein Tco_0883711 [Tanacetum coccineum]